MHKPAAARERRESRAAFTQAAKSMRRTVRAVAMLVTIPEHTDRAQRILERSGLFMPRAEIEDMARECAEEYVTGQVA